MKLIFFKPLVPVVQVEHGTVYHSGDGFWRDHIHPQRCSQLIPQKGLTANGRRRPGRMCLNSAMYATYTGAEEEIHKWVDPLCTQHHRKRMTTPTPTKQE